MAHCIRLSTSNGNVTETRVVPGIRGGDRAIKNGSKVVTFTVEDAAGKPVGEGTVVVPPGGRG